MKRTATVLAWVLVACSAAAEHIAIFHTNDIHGRFVPDHHAVEGDSLFGGGMAALEWHLDSLRRLFPYALYLDAGDLMTGNPICQIEYGGVAGGALLEMLRRCGLSAMCLGNHEFDLGAEHVRAFIAAAPFPVLCANVYDRAREQLLAPAARVFFVGNLQVGVIGLLTPKLAAFVSRSIAREFEVTDVVQTAQRMVDSLDTATDLIVLLTHLGFSADSMLATQVRGADVIIGGHSHTRILFPQRVGQTFIAQAGAYGRELGVLDLVVAGDSVQECRGSLVALQVPVSLTGSRVAPFADSIQQLIQSRYGRVIGELGEPWTVNYYSTSRAGNWICDRLRERFAADVALLNAGGLRANWKPGPITMLAVLELCPFANRIVTFEATGEQLRATALQQARAFVQRTHGVLEMSGMTVYVESDAEGSLRATAEQSDGRPLQPEQSYRVVTIDFVAESQWQQYLGFEPHFVDNSGRLLSDFLTEEILQAPQPIRADSLSRLRRIP